jgi:hypothetical protein
VSGSDVTLIQWRHSLANQWPAACLCHTKVLDQLSWNLDGGEIKEETTIWQWKRKKRQVEAK